MMTLDKLLKELKNVPAERLEDLYAVILSMQTGTKKANNKKEEILSYAGSLKDMEEKDYLEFVEQTRQTRANLFDRDVDV